MAATDHEALEKRRKLDHLSLMLGEPGRGNKAGDRERDRLNADDQYMPAGFNAQPFKWEGFVSVIADPPFSESNTSGQCRFGCALSLSVRLNCVIWC